MEKTLSGGEKQRMNSLRTLVEEKYRFWILDVSHLSALDVKTTNKIYFTI